MKFKYFINKDMIRFLKKFVHYKKKNYDSKSCFVFNYYKNLKFEKNEIKGKEKSNLLTELLYNKIKNFKL